MKKFGTFICLLICLQISAQTFTPEDALQKFAKYPQERIFVKFDKADYLAGETMHFKAYVFAKFNLSQISTNLYFEYSNKDKEVIYKNAIPIYSGIAEGSFSIPKELAEDVYYFRAYTSWMLNFDEKFQYIKPLNIYNPASATKLVTQPAEWFASIHPEGGTFLDNVESKVAVRLHSMSTLPKHFTGYIFENSDSSKKIADINFVNQEIGSFDIMPAFGKNYSLKITDNDNSNRVFALPKIMQQGAVIATINSPGAIDYSIATKGITDGLKGYKILAQNQGEVIYSALIKNSSEAVTSSILIDSLTKGIVQITLFDAQGKPVAERLCFAPPKLTDAIPQVQFAKNSSAQKGLNEWTIEADTINTYTYTVEVNNDNDYIDNTPNFLTAFWLGDVSSQPINNEYFNANNPDAANALDLLLISEKWGRFEWNKLLNNPVPKLKYIPDNFLTWQGEVLHNRKPVANEKIGIVIQMPDSAKIFIPVKTDNEGKFIMKNIDFKETAKAFYRINNINTADKNIDVTFSKMDDSKPYVGELPATLYKTVTRSPIDSVPQKIKDYAAALNSFDVDEKYKTLSGVVVKAKAKNPADELNKSLSSPLFREPGEIVFDFINENKNEASGGIIDWLNGKVPGLTVEGGVAYMRGQAVKIYINEFISDYEQLSSYPPTEIAMVKVLRTPFMLGSGTPVVAVYTKTASMFKAEMANLNSVKITGYPTVEKFQTVDYSDSKFNPGDHDTRSVLYWNTKLNPEKNKQTVTFYNNDISKKYRLIVMGFSRNGVPVYLDKEISF